MNEKERRILGVTRHDNACRDKIRYGSVESALKAKKAMERKKAPRKFSAYLCPWCNKYHLGGSPLRKEENG